MPDTDVEEQFDTDELRARSFWSGTLTFGLVSVPVALFPANRPQHVALRMLAPDGTPLRRQYYDPRNNRSVGNDDLVRGFELKDDEYVVLTEEELESAEPEKTRDIDLRVFVPRDQLDPLFFDRAYYLTPAGESTKAYKLLAETMEKTGRAGIATFVMRAREYLIAILAQDGIMRAETLRFADEIRSPEDVGLPEPLKVKASRKKEMTTAINKLTRKTFDADELVDRTAERLLKVIKRKQKEGIDIVESDVDGDEPPDDIIDLMEVLKRSLGGERAKPKKAPARKAANTAVAKKSTAAKKSAAKRTAKKSTAAKKSAPKKNATKTRARKAG